MKGDRLRGSSILGRPRAMFFAWRFAARRLRVKPVRRPLSSSWSLGEQFGSRSGPPVKEAPATSDSCAAPSPPSPLIALVLISTLPWVEVWFDGIDRAAIWHRRAAITGVVLLVPHILLSKSSPTGGSGNSLGVVGALGLLALVVWAIVPRWRSVLPRFVRPAVVAVRDLPGLRHARALLGGYERWRTFHRLTGVFVAIAFVHGILDATPFPGAPALRWIYVTIGGIGLAFYLYREFLARHFVALHDYQVERVELFDDGMMEISLKPLGAPMHFVPGQFAMLYLEARPAGDVTRFRSPARLAPTSCGSR